MVLGVEGRVWPDDQVHASQVPGGGKWGAKWSEKPVLQSTPRGEYPPPPRAPLTAVVCPNAGTGPLSPSLLSFSLTTQSVLLKGIIAVARLADSTSIRMRTSSRGTCFRHCWGSIWCAPQPVFRRDE